MTLTLAIGISIIAWVVYGTILSGQVYKREDYSVEIATLLAAGTFLILLNL